MLYGEDARDTRAPVSTCITNQRAREGMSGRASRVQ